MDYRNSHNVYSTDSEIIFLYNIGNYSKNCNRIKCLEGYIKSAKNRVNWGIIDKHRVIKLAKDLLKKET